MHLYIYLFVSLLLFLLFTRAYYKIIYNQWIQHPLDFNLYFKFPSQRNTIQFIEDEFNMKFSTNKTSEFSIETIGTRNINHHLLYTKDENQVANKVYSVEVVMLNDMKAFYMHTIQFDDTSPPNKKANIMLHHLQFCLQMKQPISIGLFKREKQQQLSCVKPLCSFHKYEFSVKKWNKPSDQLILSKYKLIPIGSSNFHLFTHFWSQIEKKDEDKNKKNFDFQFDFYIRLPFEIILQKIKDQELFVSLLIANDDIVAAYFFKKIEEKCLHSFASVNYCTDARVFIHAFKITFWNIANKNDCNRASIDATSHNSIIIQNIKIKTHPTAVTPYSYYFYNHFYPTTANYRCLIIL